MTDNQPDWRSTPPPHVGAPAGPRWSEPDAEGRRYVIAPAPPAAEPPLWLPWYGASFFGALRRYVKKYARFDGRASRSEFWWAHLGTVIATYIVQIPYIIGFFMFSAELSTRRLDREPHRDTIAGAFGQVFSMDPLLLIGIILLLLWALFLIVPTLAIAARRFHDSNHSAWWLFIYFVPFAGSIALIVFACLPSDPRGQRFDRPPTGATRADAGANRGPAEPA